MDASSPLIPTPNLWVSRVSVQTSGQLISDITDEVIREWIVGKSFSVRESMQVISMRAILRAVFGLSEGLRYQQLEKLLGTMLNETSSPLSVSLLYFPVLRQDLGPLSP